MVAYLRAAMVGATKPGRCASSTPSRSVAFSIWLGHGEPVGHGRAVRDEHPVEAGLLVHAGDAIQVIGLDDGAEAALVSE